MFFDDDKHINILCLTETKNTYDKVKLGEGLISFSTRRNENDRKGGGIQVIMPKIKQLKFKKIKNDNTELLELEGTIFGMGLKMVVVYFDVRKNQEGNRKNKKIRKDVEKIIEKNEKEGLIILGDFNGHLKMIDGRDDDQNGLMLMDWIEKLNLVMLNLDDRTEGKYTWGRNNSNSKTVIDYIMVNEKMYDCFIKMEIDENKYLYGDSDHNFLSGFFKVNRGKK